MKNKHTFTAPLAGILLTVTQKFKVNQPFHLQRDLNLCKSEYCNFQKLRYFGLVNKAYRNGKRLEGYWLLEPYVEVVLYNDVTLPRWVETYNNEVVRRSKEQILFKDAYGTYEIPELWARRAEPMRFGTEKQLRFVDELHTY